MKAPLICVCLYLKLRRLFCLLLLFVLIACDPGQSLRIENTTDTPASVTFVFKPGHDHYMFEEFADSDTLRIELDPTPENSFREYHFGIGTWDIQGSLDSLVAMIELIEIETKKSKEIFRGRQQIRTFLEKNISGSRKEVIDIKLE